jgi:hypothetical protein
MKTKITFCTLIIASIAVFTCFDPNYCGAQITITQSDMPHAGNTYITAYDTTPNVIPGGAGPGQTWNLSAIKNQYVDSLIFVTPSATPYFSYFPTSNLACHTILGGPIKGYGYSYFILNSNSYQFEGIFMLGPGVELETSDPYVTESFPINYLTHWSNSVRQIAKMPLGSDSTEEIMRISTYDTVDAWGTVTTSEGTFSVLRVKEISMPAYDSVFYYAPSTGWNFLHVTTPVKGESYSWWGNGKGGDIAQLDYDSLGGHIKVARYLKVTNAGITELNSISTVQVYPNPALNSITIETPLKSEIEILNIHGQLIESLVANNNKAIIDISSFPSGVYFLKVYMKKGIEVRKFVKE